MATKLQQTMTINMLAEYDASALGRLSARCRDRAKRMRDEDRPASIWDEKADWLENEAARLRQQSTPDEPS